MKYVGIENLGTPIGFQLTADLALVGEAVDATAKAWKFTVSGVLGASVAVMLSVSGFQGRASSSATAPTVFSVATAPPAMSKAAVARAKALSRRTTSATLEDERYQDPDHGF